MAKVGSGPRKDPLYLYCECGAFLGPASEETPMISKRARKASYAASGPVSDGHAVRVLARSALRAEVGDQSAADALDRLAEHRAACC